MVYSDFYTYHSIVIQSGLTKQNQTGRLTHSTGSTDQVYGTVFTRLGFYAYPHAHSVLVFDALH